MTRKISPRLTALIASGLLLISSPTLAASQPTAVSPGGQQSEATTSITIADHVVVISGRVAVGVLNGDASEIVYNPSTGSRLSHLEWQLENVAMVGFGGSITPLSWLRLNADVWLNMSEGSGYMDDYDWFVEGLPWTDWSHHEDTDVDDATMFDLNAEFTLFGQGDSTLFGIVGLKRDNFEWTAKGGTFVYSFNGFRDTRGSFPDGLEVISYEQTFTTPYIGVGFTADLSPITLTGRLIGSTLVDLDTVDYHYLRDLKFEDDFEEGTLIAVDLGMVYEYTDRLHFGLGFHFQKYDEMKGSTTITDLRTGQVQRIGGDAAGADNEFAMITAVIAYTFN